MINYIGLPIKGSDLYFTTSTFSEFDKWISKLPIYQLDCESNPVDSIVERKLTLIQFGDYYGKNIYVIDPRKLTREESLRLVEILNNPLPKKLIHNASFEYSLLKKYGVILSDMIDTMLQEKIKWCGYTVDKGFYSLSGLCERYLGIELDKTLQTSFGVEEFTIPQIFYAAQDVQHLGKINSMQLYYDGDKVPSLTTAKLLNVCALENEVVAAFSEIEYNGMKLDTVKWRENIALAQPVIDSAAKKLDEYLKSEEFRHKAIELGYLTDKDELAINWNSTLDKKKVFSKLYPDLQGITKSIIIKYLKTHQQREDDIDTRLALFSYLEKDYQPLTDYLLDYHKDWLLENNLLIPANTSKISWTSGKQVLTLLKATIAPKLKSVSKESLANVEHPLIDDYHEFLNTTKLKTTYGEKFISEYVDSDGKVRTNFNQVLTTGRVSSSSPNLQNIPAKENLEVVKDDIVYPYTRYRNSFVADEGWTFVDSDYKSQEAVEVASFSGDKVWMEALANEQDLHSVCAEVVFQDKWKDAAEDNCQYYINKKKCKCKKHKTLRTLVKTINFGLVYGMSKVKLSATAKISLEEAQETIDRYFNAFPGIGGILTAFGNYGIKNGFIMTSKPFNRRRYYDYWEGNQWDRKAMSKIERASKNMPFQGTAGDITKLALCLMYWYIKDNNLWNTIKLVCQVHDQITTNVIDSYSEEWIPLMDKFMCEAADFVLPKGLLTAETLNTGNFWTK